MGSKQPSHTTQTTEVKLPAWVNQASEGNYQMAEDVAARPLVQYEGDRVAGLTPDQQKAISIASGKAGSTDWMTNTASGALATASGYQPERVTAGQIGDTDLSKYLNPYTNEVENNALRALDDSRVKSLMGNADKAVAAGAFGGSRSGIVDAVTNAETAKASGDLSALLRKEGFDRATSLAGQDIDRRFSADTANQTAGLAGNGQRIQGALGLNQTANDAQQRYMRDFATLMESGSMQQTQNQQLIDADMAKFYENRDYPLEQLNIRLAALGMSPYGKTETASKTASGGRAGTDWAQAGVGALSLLGGLFSDKDEKTDIKKLGKDPASGVDLYAYRYKDDPKSYPKVVGPMAQDIEKRYPGSTRRVGGKMVVNS